MAFRKQCQYFTGYFGGNRVSLLLLWLFNYRLKETGVRKKLKQRQHLNFRGIKVNIAPPTHLSNKRREEFSLKVVHCFTSIVLYHLTSQTPPFVVQKNRWKLSWRGRWIGSPTRRNQFPKTCGRDLTELITNIISYERGKNGTNWNGMKVINTDTSEPDWTTHRQM